MHQISDAGWCKPRTVFDYSLGVGLEKVPASQRYE